MSAFFFLLSAGFTALNAALFVAHGSPWNMAAAIFCGLVAIFHLAEAVSE